MRATVVFTVLFMGLNTSNICHADQSYPDVTITPFPIMSWVPPALTDEQLGWFSEAGFNVMSIYPNEDAYDKMKENWNGNWMVFKEWSGKGYDYKTMSDFHADDPKRIGFMLGDEPTTPQIDKYVSQYDYLRSKHPDDICLVNIFPSYVSETRIGSTYRKYIEAYYKKLRPRYSSLDHYPCFRFDYDLPSFYHDLEMQREISGDYNCKQFGFVQVYSSRTDRDISASDLAWQVNSFLAYNCKGLWYFYFRHPQPGINDLSGRETIKTTTHELALDYNDGRRPKEYYKEMHVFGSGVLNVNDKKGERFGDVVKVNKETLAWGETLIGLKNLRVRHIRGFNDGTVPVGTDEFAGSKGWFGVVELYIASVRAVEQHKSMGYIVSYFEDKAKRPYVMIVNKRHGEFMSRKGGALKTVLLFTEDVKNVYSVSSITGKEENVKLSETNVFEKDIEGGGAILLRLVIE